MITQKEHDEGIRTCDKCGFKTYSDFLIWPQSEDFTPKKGEILSKLASRYDALCESCYQSMLNK